MSSTKHPALLEIDARLRASGFKRRRTGVFTRDVNDDVLGWVGLNLSTRAAAIGVVVINPVVGVRHQPVERLVAEGEGARFHPHVPPTISRSISSITDAVGVNDFIVHGNEGDAATVDSLVEAVLTHGNRFMEEFASPARMLKELSKWFLANQDAGYRYPTLLWLTGDADAARHAIGQELDAMADRVDVAAAEQRAFLEWLSRKVEGQG